MGDFFYKYLYIKVMLNNCYIDYFKLYIMLGLNEEYGIFFYSCLLFLIIIFIFDVSRVDSCFCLKVLFLYNILLFIR